MKSNDKNHQGYNDGVPFESLRLYKIREEVYLAVFNKGYISKINFNLKIQQNLNSILRSNFSFEIKL